jgi:hypothetical protein
MLRCTSWKRSIRSFNSAESLIAMVGVDMFDYFAISKSNF